MARVVNGALVARAAGALVMGGTARELRGHHARGDSLFRGGRERDREQRSSWGERIPETLSLAVLRQRVVNDRVQSGAQSKRFANWGGRIAATGPRESPPTIARPLRPRLSDNSS